MKYLSVLILVFLISCNNKEDVFLPKSNVTIVSHVVDHSPIYIFFRIKGKDTLVEVNKKNEIISTSWIFNIDKRLPLRLVIPEVIKLQEKKRGEVAHKNEKAENYFSYADSIGRNLAFLPFTKVHYKMMKPTSGVIIFFDRNNKIVVDSKVVKKENFQNYLDNLPSDKPNKFQFCFDENLSYGNYIQIKVFMASIKTPVPKLNYDSQEFVY